MFRYEYAHLLRKGRDFKSLGVYTSELLYLKPLGYFMDSPRDALERLHARIEGTMDSGRKAAIAKRHAKGYRSARENVAELSDEGSFIEYGQMAVAAQRMRRDYEELKSATAADGIITGLATVNSELHDKGSSKAALIVNDYTVLAGTQGYFHHKKLDRILEVAQAQNLPVIMMTEGGGGRPGDTDALTQIAGLNITSFSAWAGLSGKVLRIAVNNGYCFAGNAALFGCADIKIATQHSWIGMAGPAMIEGGGLGSFKPTEIGPVDVQSGNGVIDIVVNDEVEACAAARKVLSYFQGDLRDWSAGDQNTLIDGLPEDRRYSYKIRSLIEILVDQDSFVELKPLWGTAMVTGLVRIEGRAMGLIANDCRVLGGAIDAVAAEKTAAFLRFCEAQSMPVLALGDTPGFMVGPESEKDAAVRHFSDLFVAGAQLKTPLVTVFLRKGYGLGAMAMAGGSFAKPNYCVAWPSGEFGGMGLEGAVQLGFKKELDEQETPDARKALFDSLVAESYERGKATEAAAHLEIDAVIDPVDTRKIIVAALN